MNNFLNGTISLLLLSLAISTRRSKLKTYKKAYHSNIPLSTAQTGPRNIGKIQQATKYFWLEKKYSTLKD